MELIRLQGVQYSYPDGPPVLRGLDFSLSSGQRLGIYGPNGAGKSTLFQAAMGLLCPLAGEVWGLGRICRREEDFRELRRTVGYVFQDPEDQLFCPTVLEDVAFGLLNLGQSREEARERSLITLNKLGLAELGDRVTYRLSGGEKRLVSLAAVLAMEPRGLLLDEPANGLDPEHAARLERVLNESGMAWAMVSHDRSLLARTCDTFWEMAGGRLRPLDSV